MLNWQFAIYNKLVIMNQPPLREIDLHDGRILATRIDYVKRTLELDVEFYAAMEHRDRTRATISFENLIVFSAMIEALELEDNAKPGNISFWEPNENPATTTFIYLVGGTLAVTASAVSFKTQA